MKASRRIEGATTAPEKDLAPTWWRDLTRAPVETIGTFLGETVWAWDLTRMPRHRRWGALLLRMIYLVGRGFVSRRAQVQAMALTYTTMLALVPAFAIIVAVFSLGGLEEPRARLETFIFDAIAATPEQEHNLSRLLNEIVTNLQASQGVAGVAFLCFLFLTIVALLSTLEKTLNDVWGITRQRSFIQKFVTYWCIATLGPLLLGTALVHGSSLWHKAYDATSGWVGSAAPPPRAPRPEPVAAAGPDFGLPGVTGALLDDLERERARRRTTGSAGAVDAGQVFEHILTGTRRAATSPGGTSFPAFGLTVLTFAFIYAFLPNTRVRLAPAFIGALATTSLWVVTKWVLAASSSTLVSYNTLYGSLATIPITMFWLYLSWLIVILGAEITFALQNLKSQRREELATEATPLCKELVALRLIAAIAHAYEHGKPPPTKEWLAERIGAPHSLCVAVLHHLAQDGLLRDVDVADERGYVPARPIDRIALADVIDSLRERHGVSFDLAWGDDLPVLGQHLGQANAAAKTLASRVTIRQVVDALDVADRARAAGGLDPAAAAVSVVTAKTLAATSGERSAELRAGTPAAASAEAPPAPGVVTAAVAAAKLGEPVATITATTTSPVEAPDDPPSRVAPVIVATGRIIRIPAARAELERIAAAAVAAPEPAPPAPK